MGFGTLAPSPQFAPPSFFVILGDVGLLDQKILYKAYSLIPLGDEWLQGGGYESIPSLYVHAICMTHQASEVFVGYRCGYIAINKGLQFQVSIHLKKKKKKDQTSNYFYFRFSLLSLITSL